MTTTAPLPAVATLQTIPAPNQPDAVADLCMREVFRDERGRALLIRWRESWWGWDAERGCWQPLTDEALDGRLQRALRYASFWKPQPGGGAAVLTPWNPTPTTVTAVRLMLREHAAIPHSVELGSWLNGRRDSVVSCRQSYLCYEPDNPALDLPWSYHDADPNLFQVHALSVRYDPDAAEPVEWLAFLRGILDQEGIDLLQEWCGYVLSGRTHRHVAMQIIGPPRSGKSLIGRVLSALLGDSARATTIQSLNGDFGLQGLLGASLITMNDVRLQPGREGLALGQMLGIIGEDPMTVNRKGQPEIPGVRMPGRFMLTGNSAIAMKDDSGALDARWLFLRTLDSFRGREDRDLERRLTTPEALQSLIPWALIGLERLDRTGAFTVQHAASDDREEALLGGSPLLEFVSEHCVREGVQNFDEFYFRYVSQSEIRPRPTKTSVRSSLKAAGFMVTRPKDAMGYNLPWEVRGLRLSQG